MDQSRDPKRIEVRDAREKAIATLTEAFARDDLELEDLEGRLAKLHNASGVQEIQLIIADLKPSVAVPAPVRTLLPTETREEQTFLAIMGGTERRGEWNGAPNMRAVALMGGVVLDFRRARLPAGIVELEVYALMGGVEIIVPPDLAVDTSGTGIMGGFAHVARAPSAADPDRPILRITGLALMGGVHVETRLPGESGREARRREKRERKALHAGR